MRYRSRIGRRDENERPIIDALEALGCTVLQLNEIDILCGYRGKNVLIEVKNPNKPPSKRKLTPAQVKLRTQWRGQYCVVHTPEEALKEVIAATLI